MKPTTRTAVAVAALAAVIAAPVAAADGFAADEVDLAAALKAAQIDPRKDDQAPTEGAEDDVTLVEEALQAKGLLARKWVDGHFGSETINAYVQFQKSLGYEGVAANGLPGVSSLTKLGSGQFTVTNVVKPGAKTTHGGKTVNARTKAMLVEAEKLADRELTLDQGSYSPGEDPTSAGTHDGGGTVDINIDGMSEAARTALVKSLRQVGFAAWHRTPSQGDWPHHIHAVAINDADLSAPARNQIGDYYLGRDGLAGQGPDDGPTVQPIRTWEEYQRMA